MGKRYIRENFTENCENEVDKRQDFKEDDEKIV